ncbi:sensor histidine kinase [Pontibacter sp. H249]|uniref:sensor histidine kinase n=1 Tax=Pontibacter sp. H249 TaxID=3133420 RepID=UPI0030BF81BC
MKLLHKTTGLYLAATTVILLFTGFVLVAVIHKLENDEIDEELRLQYDSVAEQLAQGQVKSMALASIERLELGIPASEIYGDSLIFDKIQNKYEDYKYLKVTQQIGGINYRVIVMDAHIGWKEYNQTILLIFLVMGVMLGVSGALINFFAAKTIWKPFFSNLNTLKKYAVSSDKPLQLQTSGVQEFEELRLVLEEMAIRSANEFRTLREFTENASHEIQTPLAIIKSKLDRLSQYPMEEDMSEHIVMAKSGVERLSRLNKSLLLLAKLENKAFTDQEQLNFCELLQQQLEQMEELFALRHIDVSANCTQVSVLANRYLCELLISNLLSNALRYTQQDGKITAVLTKSEFRISNTGNPIALEQGEMFRRFKKGNQNSKATGLGLAIVNEICLSHAWQISYTYEQEQHYFAVRFSS